MEKQRWTTRKKILIAGSMLIGLLLVGVIVGLVYVQDLFSLVDRGEVTGNPSLQESDLIDPEETVIPTPAVTSGSGSLSDPTSTGGSTTESATETTAIVTTEPLMALRTDPDVYNILLIGTDNRGNEINGRSDAMIIFSINKRTKKIHLVSLMRGLYVDIPGRGFSMLNNSFSFGGSKLLRQTIENNLRVKIDDYVLINFSGFVQAIDTVGGVEISLTEAEAKELNGQFGSALTAGLTMLNGEQSLAYARIRHIDSDYKRTGRQRKVIECLLTRMRGLSAADLDATMRQLLPLVKTNLSSTRMISLGLDLLKRKSYPVSQLMLPINGTFETIIVRNIQVVQFDFNDNIAALQEFLFDD